MAYNNERLARAIITILSEELPTALDAVEDLWASAAPATLPNPVDIVLGHKPTLLALPSAAFPLVCVIPPTRQPQRGPATWGAQEQIISVYLDYFTVAEDEDTVNIQTMRYAEALVTTMQGHRSVAGCRQSDFEPAVDLSEATRHGRTSDADMFDVAQVDFIQGGRITLTFEDL